MSLFDRIFFINVQRGVFVALITPKLLRSQLYLVYTGEIRCLHGKEGNVLFNDALNIIFFTVIWPQTYGKEPLR